MNDSTSPISPAWPTRWPKNSFKSVWTWIVAGFIAGLFVVVFIFSLKNPAPKIVNPLEIDLVIGVQFFIDGLLVALALGTLPALSKFSLAELGFRAPTPRVLLVALLGFGAMFVVADGSAALIDAFTKGSHPQDIVQMFKQIHDPATIVIFVAFAVLFAPFAEEALFRIFFFNLGLRYGGFWGGAVLSGILFGVAHGDVYAAIPLALGGMVLCGVYYFTRNAYASMISHALFNTLSIVTLLAGPKVT